jgi:hypothetical protein
MIMNNDIRKEYLHTILPRYRNASKSEKIIILDEFCSVCHYNRKYAIRLLNGTRSGFTPKKPAKRGPKTIYKHPDLLKILKHLWRLTNLPCSKRLKALIPLWLPFYPYYLSESLTHELLTISAATIDRLMKPMRSKFNKLGLSSTKPGSILSKHIPVKTGQWNEAIPGYLEADTIAHCGTSVAGMFVYSINCVDIATGWNAQRAVWGKGERGVIAAIRHIEASLPFPILGFDCDNGSEFLNWHLYRYFSHRKVPVQFTRSRPYQKNDNAHIEEKNWTHIRQYLGYQRFDSPELVDLLNDLYTSEWSLYFNFFIPSTKLIQKLRIGSKLIKKHDTPKTPLQRLLTTSSVPDRTIEKLKTQYSHLNPFDLQKQMSHKIKRILSIVNTSSNAELLRNSEELNSQRNKHEISI